MGTVCGIQKPCQPKPADTEVCFLECFVNLLARFRDFSVTCVCVCVCVCVYTHKGERDCQCTCTRM